MGRWFTLVLLYYGLCSDLWGSSRNILVTGYWPPTNSMLRRLNNNPALNPDGWVGENFEGSGYDIYAYFPTFKEGDSVGLGDFPVDYAATFNDFMFYTSDLLPIAIVSFGRGAGPWELEAISYPHFATMFRSGYIPSSLGEALEHPIPNTLGLELNYPSSLPLQSILTRVNAIPENPLHAWIDDNGGAGSYLCGFIAYLGGWYHSVHSDPLSDDYNAMAGFIHVGGAYRDSYLDLTLKETLRAVVAALIDHK